MWKKVSGREWKGNAASPETSQIFGRIVSAHSALQPAMLRSLVAFLAFIASANALAVSGVVSPTGTGLNGLLARRSVAKYDSSKAVPAEAVRQWAPNPHILVMKW